MPAATVLPADSPPSGLIYVSSRLGIRNVARPLDPTAHQHFTSGQHSTSGHHPADRLVDAGEEFRLLTPEWYAWLRLRMEKARAAHACGKLAEGPWQALRGQFNAINGFALTSHGEQALTAALAKARSEGNPPGASTRRPAPEPPPRPVAPPSFLFPPVGTYHFTERVSPEAVAMVDAIRDRALALGWTLPQLYQNRGNIRFPCGKEWGLVTMLSAGRWLGEVTLQYIEIHNPGPRPTTNRFHNMEVEQPWLKKVKAE